MLSPFGFVRAGIVVDAFIVGENTYRHQEERGDALRGSIEDVYQIVKPVTFAVLAAFSPLPFVPGILGKVSRVIALLVIPCPVVLGTRAAERPAVAPRAHILRRVHRMAVAAVPVALREVA